ncbi:methyltransferase like 3, putative [Ichthyophthirius multifiliis]|uniref:Methyltransferase like 3, putative n=1 Tax=Ichthyophthirius multifiliis TaxID=5932 RepID=G0QXP7_ICHMU|nr:methyltransferase like 3, putative [Ichthyophthirius multifiliis]EGR29984.1 methyltransferase like 3, putative [Ichthyophthirius multifiliis]|eukprot:XP_004031220.1 methyltransferase like 3, putative [Ichthyophthirius multifiliis]
MRKIQKEIDELNNKYFPSKSYINCDIKYFNLDLLVQNIGYFDIIYMDPPWRIKGGQQVDSQFMFSNSKFSLEYNTMSNKDIIDINIETLSKKGFLFLWILNTQMDIACQMMQKWGYEVVDKLIWIKMKDKNIQLTHGYYFMHSFEMCLIGYKNNEFSGESKSNYMEQNYPQFHQYITNNVIFSEVRKKSQKPDEIYEIIELLIPGSKKIEIFARNNNLRPGWLSLGNQLGETYEQWLNLVCCDECKQEITKQKLMRYKSKYRHNYDLCQNCVQHHNKEDFFEIQNKVYEDVLHQYQQCNHCRTEPIWGIRFHCLDCQDFDLCEACVDLNIKENDKFHDQKHQMQVIEVPIYADGFPVHDKRCSSCYMMPITGTCFTCHQCSGNFNLCQNCFFNKSSEKIANKRHKQEHVMDPILSPTKNSKTKKYKCGGCGLANLNGEIFKCLNCYCFYFCQSCYDTKRDNFKTNIASSHKTYHTLVKIQTKNEDLDEKKNENENENDNDLKQKDQIHDQQQLIQCVQENNNNQQENNKNQSLQNTMIKQRGRPKKKISNLELYMDKLSKQKKSQENSEK